MADDPIDGEPTPTPKPPEARDEFEGLVLDESFVRGGTYEPPARTRVAIARFGDQQTSWRHGGGLRRRPTPPAARAESTRARRPSPRRTGARGPRQQGPARSAHPALPSPLLARLPIIVTVVVVILAAFLAFR